MAKVITVVNQKGGVGKTTTACHLVFAISEKEKTGLLVDFDVQGNASQIFTRNENIVNTPGGSELLFGNHELKYSETKTQGIKVLHGHSRLEVLDDARDEILKEAAKMRSKVRNLPFDYVVFDTPPAIGPRQVAPMFWSDLVLIPVEPTSLSMSGLSTIFNTLKGVLKVNPGLIIRLVINRIVKSSSVQNKMQSQLEEKLKKNKLGPQIIAEFSHRVHVSDALAVGQPVWHYKKAAKDEALKAAWKSFADRVFELLA